MAVTVLVELQAVPETRDELVSILLADVLPGIREKEGCERIDLLIDHADPHRLIVAQHWEKREQHEAYMAWRDETGTGTTGRLAPMLVGGRQVRYFDMQS